MILFYVYGSGLGHLNRVLNYINLKRLDTSSCIILTNSKHTDYISQEINVLKHEDSFFKKTSVFFKTLKEYIVFYKVEELIVDVFPSGFYGELKQLDTLKIQKTILARILNTSYFEKYPCSPKYNVLITLEKGIVLGSYEYDESCDLRIYNREIYSEKSLVVKDPFFLIIHSEPKEEVLQLYKLAKLYQKNEEHIYIQTFVQDIHFTEEDVTVIVSEKLMLSLLEKSVKIFTACGFNTFFQTEKYRNKQHFLPFKRRFDDQFKRKYMNK